jgi:hypothetical protein
MLEMPRNQRGERLDHPQDRFVSSKDHLGRIGGVRDIHIDAVAFNSRYGRRKPKTGRRNCFSSGPQYSTTSSSQESEVVGQFGRQPVLMIN